MKTFLALFLCSVVLTVESFGRPLTDEHNQLYSHWSGFAPGSWTKYKVDFYTDKGVLVEHKVNSTFPSDVRSTLRNVTDDKVVVRVEESYRVGDWLTPESSDENETYYTLLTGQWANSSIREESIRLNGEWRPCTVVLTSFNEDGSAFVYTDYWCASGFPGPVRTEHTDLGGVVRATATAWHDE